MRIGKCINCKNGEMFIIGMNWNGWREFKCNKCNYILDNKNYDSINYTDCINEEMDICDECGIIHDKENKIMSIKEFVK